MALTSSSTERVETPWTPAFAGAGSGFLDYRSQRLLGHAPRFEKGREITALAQLWDAQLNGAGAGLPDPITVPIAVIDPLRAALAMRRAGHALDFQLHQALRSKTHHLAQQIGVGALL